MDIIKKPKKWKFHIAILFVSYWSFLVLYKLCINIYIFYLYIHYQNDRYLWVWIRYVIAWSEQKQVFPVWVRLGLYLIFGLNCILSLTCIFGLYCVFNVCYSILVFMPTKLEQIIIRIQNLITHHLANWNWGVIDRLPW